MKLYRNARSAIVKAMNLASSINFDGVVVSCFSRRTDLDTRAYADLNVGMGYQLTLLDDLPHGVSLSQVIKQQSRGIYPVIKTTDNLETRLFCITEYLTLADGAVALNGYVCYNRTNN